MVVHTAVGLVVAGASVRVAVQATPILVLVLFTEQNRV